MSTLDKQNIFIIGPLGAGKSSVGNQIAKLLRRPFFDSDREVELKSGVDIDWMFAVEGEQGFRLREQQVIEGLCQKNGIVLATGGGTLCNPNCKALLQANGIVIYLKVSFSEQLKRVKRFPAKRPMLEDTPEAKLKALNEQREKLYASIADFTYDNLANNPNRLAQKIISDLKKHHQGQ